MSKSRSRSVIGRRPAAARAEQRREHDDDHRSIIITTNVPFHIHQIIKKEHGQAIQQVFHTTVAG